MNKIYEALSCLESLGIQDPTGEQIKAYERYALENQKDKGNNYSLVHNKIRLYKEIGLTKRSKKLDTQLNHLRISKHFDQSSRYPEHTLRCLGMRVLEEVCKYQERVANYLTYLATGDDRFGRISLFTIYTRPIRYTDYIEDKRDLSIREITEILEHSYNIGALDLNDITLGTPLQMALGWKKTRKGYEIARSFGRAIETSHWWKNKGGEKNEIYRRHIRPYNLDSHRFWSNSWNHPWEHQGLSKFIVTKEANNITKKIGGGKDERKNII